jgi:FAD/FMN-containing dehydrogenase
MEATDDEVETVVEKSWGPVAAFGRGAYPGFLSTATERDVADVFPGETYARLAQIKKIYDPQNVFARNHNVRPA